VDAARESVAGLIGAKSSEIVFTCGGTESDNLAMFGIVNPCDQPRRHVVTTAIEHHAVLNAAQALEKQGVDVTYVPVGGDGIVDPEEIREAIRPETVLISVMLANNEIGTIQPVEEIGRVAAEEDIYFHCDAVQAAGKLAIDVRKLGVDLLSISGHKLYAAKGVGALYVRAGTELGPIFYGGHHERDRRPGTENVPGIAGLGKAAELAAEYLASSAIRLGGLRDRFEKSLLNALPGVKVNGSVEHRVPNTCNLFFDAAGGEALVIALDLQGVMCSSGAACSSGAVEPSHVLTAIGLLPDQARSSLRFSLGRPTTEHEIDEAIRIIPPVVERLRALSPLSAGASAIR
jgi:cysteine desulfurase